MSNQALAWWATFDKTGMRPSTVIVGWWLADRARDRSHACGAQSHEQLGRSAGVSARSARRAVYELRDAGVIDVVPIIGPHGDRPSRLHWCGWIVRDTARDCCTDPAGRAATG